jgi:hypothetical protein
MNNNSFEVKDALRKVHRDLKESLSNDVVSYISEILTNSDDSYRRLENSNYVPRDTIKPVSIHIIKERRKVGGYVIQITDNAEGMSETELRQKFESYGADKSNGETLYTRGLFGQGATDVLFNAAYDGKTAMIETIKNGEITRAKFNWNNDKNLKIVEFVSLSKTNNRLEEIRKSLGIVDNGTRVSFGIPDRVKFNIKTIKDEIEKYPFFRFLLSSPNRRVTLKYSDQLIEEELSSESYLIMNKEPINRTKFTFTFENKLVDAEIELFKTEQGRHNQSLLIIDQNKVIYDDHYFGYETNPKAKLLVGYLTIYDFYKIIRMGLNSENPYALIRDNRKGIETSHEFYKLLRDKVSQVMNSVLNQMADNERVLDLSNNKKIAQVIKKLNSIFLEKMPEEIPLSGKEKGIKPPVQGLEFIRGEMSLTVGKKYFVELFINSFIIDDAIPISLTVDRSSISLDQTKLKFNKSEANTFGLIRKSFLVTANELDETPIMIRAKSNQFEAEARITTLEEEVFYPKFGIQFRPDHLKHIASSSHRTFLYLDKAIYQPDLEINFESTDERVKYSTKSITVKIDDFNAFGIAKYSISLYGDDIPKKSKIMAQYGENRTSAILEIIEKKPRDPLGMLGLISSIKFRPDKDDNSYQARFSLSDRTLYINQLNPINKTMIRNLSMITEITNKMGESQINYILDIVAYHSAIQILEYQSKHGYSDFDGSDIYLWEKSIYKQKTEIYEALRSSI